MSSTQASDNRIFSTNQVPQNTNQLSQKNEQDWVSLPDEVLFTLFEYLNIVALVNCSAVNKTWRAVALDNRLWKISLLQGHFSFFRVFSATDWQSKLKGFKNLSDYKLDFSNEPAIDRSLIIKLFSMLKQYASLPKEEYAGITLLTIPTNLSVNKLKRLTSSPEIGQLATQFSRNWTDFSDKSMNETSKKTYRLLITNRSYIVSPNPSQPGQKSPMIEATLQSASRLEAATLLVVIFLQNSALFYSKNKWCYSQRLEISSQVNAEFRYSLIGNFRPSHVPQFSNGLVCNIGYATQLLYIDSATKIE